MTKFSGGSALKTPPGEGAEPTGQIDWRGHIVGRVRSRGEPDVRERAVRRLGFWVCFEKRP